MQSRAFSGIGTKFYQWMPNGLPDPYWMKVSEINSISGPSVSREVIDVTSLDSTGGYREYKASIRDSGTISLSMNFTRETYSLFKAGFESDAVQSFKIILPDEMHTSLEFEGFVTELPVEISLTDKVTADVTIQITGQPVWRAPIDGEIHSDDDEGDSYKGLESTSVNL